MAIISEKDLKKLKEIFKSLENDVKMLFFTQELECEHCKMAKGILEEISALSDKITLQVNDFVKDAELAKKHGIDKIPAMVLLGEQDYGIRFYGVPAGYEFTSLIEDIIDVSKRDAGLQKEILDELSKVDKPVHLEVLISPTCPYCAQAVRTAHRFAMANEHITADMIELTEFPQIAVKHNVQTVPKIIINDEHSLTGSFPDTEFIQAILKTIGK